MSYQNDFSSWSIEDMTQVLEQLNNQKLPFESYAFTKENNEYVLLGRGGSSSVFRAEARQKQRCGYAIKVIGFEDSYFDYQCFYDSVRLQKKLSENNDNIVKVFEYVALRVWIENNNIVTRVEKIDSLTQELDKEHNKEQNQDYDIKDNYLDLRFVLMEELMPVFGSKNKSPHLKIKSLALYDEKEILRLAYDIGNALSMAHSYDLMHRDVKLENVFYSEKDRHYKLGDFGIARKTNDGFAETVAYSYGYGAPEVVNLIDNKYDFTADIYSFGILLYVLLNELNFPNSVYYAVNYSQQYSKGFTAEYPLNGKAELCDIVLKMISYNPDDRYQSIEEVLNALDMFAHGKRVKYQREHKSVSLVMGALFAMVGAIGFVLTFMPDFVSDFSIWSYLFYGVCIYKGIVGLRNRNTITINIALLVFGVIVVICSGFSVWRLIGVILLSAISGVTTGLIGVSILLMNFTYILAKTNGIEPFCEYQWISLLLISLSFFLLLYHTILGEREEKLTKLYISRNWYWIIVTFLYATIAFSENTLRTFANEPFNIYEQIFGVENVNAFLSLNPFYIGIAGGIFCLIWIARDMTLYFISRKKEQEQN